MQKVGLAVRVELRELVAFGKLGEFRDHAIFPLALNELEGIRAIVIAGDEGNLCKEDRFEGTIFGGS
jgi:hypothetical protein